ncbi:helix-turn-helix transcriptional regulator [Patescibacteria group bacterium]|nr:helix-turn-helix transcriptional regulator [Patescibacteria group bacterium]
MNKNKKIKKAVDFQEYLSQQLKNPEIKKHYDKFGKQLEIAYQIMKLRRQKRMSQTELARKINTKQSNIARMEMGQQNFTIDTLQKISKVFNRELKIKI